MERIGLNLAGFLLAGALMACSPAAPSISKGGFSSGNLPQKDPGSDAGNSTSGSDSTGPIYMSQVIDSEDDIDGANSPIPEDADTIRPSQADLKQFRKEGFLDFEIPQDLGALQLYVIVDLKATRAESKEAEAKTYKVKVEARTGGEFRLSVGDDVERSVDTFVRRHLDQIIIGYRRSETRL